MFLGLASLSAAAQSAEALALLRSTDDLVPEPPRPPDVIFKLGGQADSNQGQGYQGKVTWNASRALTLFLAGNRSSLASTTEAPSPDGNTTVTTTTTLGGSYLFGTFDLGLEFDHTNMSDLLTARRYYLQPGLVAGSWRIGFEFSTRKTDFETLRFNNLALNTPAGPIFVSGYADLHLSDTGIGASVEYDGEVWRPYASYTHYHYGSFEGSTDITRIRTANGDVSPLMFKAISGKLVPRLDRIATSRLNRKAAYLDSTATVGLEANLSRTKWVVEANQDLDHLTNDVSNTFTGTAGWKVTRRFTVELQVGATTSEALGTDRFVGLTLTFRTRPSLLDLVSW